MHLCQQYVSVPAVLSPCQHLGLSVFSVFVILVRVWWSCAVGFVCVSPDDFQHFFLCSLPLQIPSSVKSLFTSFARLLGWCLLSYFQVFEFIICSGYKSCIRYLPCKYSLPVCSWSLDSLNCGFQRAEVLNCDDFFVSVWCFPDCAFSIFLEVFA